MGFEFKSKIPQQRLGIRKTVASVIAKDIMEFYGIEANKFNSSMYYENLFSNDLEQDDFDAEGFIKFINVVLLNFYPEAECSFSRHRAEMSYITDEVYDEIVKHKLAELNQKFRKRDCVYSDRIRINDELRKKMEVSSESKYYVDKDGNPNIKLYFEMLIEEYVKLSRAERMRIVFMDTFSEINTAIEQNQEVTIRIKGKEELIKTIRPYKLIKDVYNMFYYLVYFELDEKNNIWTLQSRPIDKIDVIDIGSNFFKPFTGKTKDILDNRIESRGLNAIRLITDRYLYLKFKSSEDYNEFINSNIFKSLTANKTTVVKNNDYNSLRFNLNDTSEYDIYCAFSNSSYDVEVDLNDADPEQKIKIALTEIGFSVFESIKYERPKFLSLEKEDIIIEYKEMDKKGNKVTKERKFEYVLTFSSGSYDKVRQYFLRFCENVNVLQPKKLEDEFIKKYNGALTNYQK